MRQSAARQGAEKRCRSSPLASPRASPPPSPVILQSKSWTRQRRGLLIANVVQFPLPGFICRLATGAGKSHLHGGNGPSCPYLSSVCFGASALLTPRMQTARMMCQSGQAAESINQSQRIASWSWLHHMLEPSWLHFGSCVPNWDRERAANVQGINPAARQAPSSSCWLPLPAPRRIRPFPMNCQVIIIFPCLASNVSWQKISELTGFQQVL